MKAPDPDEEANLISPPIVAPNSDQSRDCHDESRWRSAIERALLKEAWNLTDTIFTGLAVLDPEIVDRHYTDLSCIHHPILGRITGLELKTAWTSLLSHKFDLALHYNICFVTTSTAEVEWSLRHRHPETGRIILLDGTTQLVFRNNLVIWHHDSFSLRDWFRQALGWKGILLSLVPGWRRFVIRETRHLLELNVIANR